MFSPCDLILDRKALGIGADVFRRIKIENHAILINAFWHFFPFLLVTIPLPLSSILSTIDKLVYTFLEAIIAKEIATDVF